MIPLISFFKESITAVPFALSSTSFVLACGHLAVIKRTAASESVKLKRLRTWSSRNVSAPRRAHT